MNILLVLLVSLVFVLSFIIVTCYKSEIRNLSKNHNNVHFYVARDANGLLCLYSGKPIDSKAAILNTNHSFEVDHIIPWANGGQTTLDNAQLLCKYHNASKGNKN